MARFMNEMGQKKGELNLENGTFFSSSGKKITRSGIVIQAVKDR